MTRHRSILALLPATAVMVAAAVPAAANAQQQALMVGSYWVGWMTQGQVSQTALATGGTAAQLYVKTNYLAPTLLDFIAQSLAGKAPSTTLQYATFAANGLPLNLLKIASTRLQEVDLPAAASNRTDTDTVGVLFTQAAYETVKPTAMPQVNPIGQVLRYNYFHLQFDSLDATSAMTVNAMAVRLPDVLKGVNLPQLVLTYGVSSTASTQVFAKGLQAWLTSQTTRNGTLTFFAADFKTPVLIIHYRGLRVVSINNAGGPIGTATFAMSGITVQGASMP